MTQVLQQITEPLLQWYDSHKRPLPWREDREPYHVWISEIMLQQTRIEAVIRYYERFMQALPDVESLSRISEDQLLKLWEGLGYYSRARNLKKAACMIQTELEGKFPSSYQELRRLPGIGDYSAGAIASICFDEKVPAVDGNVLRVISRILGSRKNVLLPETKKETEELLRTVLPERSGAFNEALMELGETRCLPNGAPDCARCPVHPWCTAFQEGLTEELPVRVKSLKRHREEKTVLLLLSPRGRIALNKRPDSGLLSGMYQLPNFRGHLSEQEIAQKLTDQGITAETITFLRNAKHVFTHIDWQMKGYLVRVAEESRTCQWATLQELSQRYALPTAFKPFLPQELPSG